MKLLVLNWQDLHNPHSGGAEVHVHNVFGRLANAGHEITLLVSGWPGCPPSATVDGMRVLRVGTRHTFGLAAPRFFRKHLASTPFDGIVETLNKVPVFAPRWATRPVALLVHHLFGITAFREAPPWLAGATWLLERGLPSVYRGIATQAMSHSTRDDLVRRGLSPENIQVIHAGIDTGALTPSPGARSPTPRFVYVGRLRRYKRVDLLLRALATLARRGHAAEAVVAGKGEHEAALRRLAPRLGISERVRFVGFISEAEKLALFRSAWANVFTSPKEGWGMTNLEAGAAGTPSVASDAPGLRESVRHGETGLLVPHGDVAALADALQGLIEQPQQVTALGTAARRFAETFTWERTAEQTARHLAGAFGVKHTPAACNL